MGKFIDLTGQKFNKLIAIEYNKEKHKWLCKCDCGRTTFVNSSNLTKGITKSCGCLSGRVGNRSISNKAPWMLKYFENPQDAEPYTICSNKKIYPICPTCGKKSKTQYMMGTIYKQNGFRCKYCYKVNRSFPERVFAAVLNHLGVEYDAQYKIEHNGKRQYIDFCCYINGKTIFVEIDGKLGHGIISFDGSEDSLLNGIYLDKNKDDYALKNNIQLIRIKCHSSKFDEIINSIFDSEIINYLDIRGIDVNEIYADSISDISNLMIEDYKRGKSKRGIAEKYKVGVDVVRRVLKNAYNHGLLDKYGYDQITYDEYVIKKMHDSAVRSNTKYQKIYLYIIDNNNVLRRLPFEYNCINDACDNSLRDIGIAQKYSNVRRVISGERKRIGNYIYSTNKFRDGETYKGKTPPRQVECVNTGDVFKTVSDACTWCGVTHKDRIVSNINKKKGYCGRHPETGEPLRWKYA